MAGGGGGGEDVWVVLLRDWGFMVGYRKAW